MQAHKRCENECKLNDSLHVTSNWSLHIMHVILEGIVSIELNCILRGLCEFVKHLNLNSINYGIQLFWGK
jgi:hypothetical protein